MTNTFSPRTVVEVLNYWDRLCNHLLDSHQHYRIVDLCLYYQDFNPVRFHQTKSIRMLTTIISWCSVK